MASQKFRILFVHSGSDLYGASRSLLRLSSRLVRDGSVVKVVLPHDGPLVPALQEQGVNVVIQKKLPVIERQKARSLFGLIGLFVNMFGSTLDLWRLMRQFEPQVVHTMTAILVSPALAAKLENVPHVWHVRESFAEFGAVWHYYQRYMLWLSSKIICVSSPIAGQFEQYRNGEKIEVIHNGFPADEFAGITQDRIDQFRSKYVSSTSASLVGVVGRIKFQRKGQEIFVQAARLLREKFPHTLFLCIGSPYPGNESHLINLKRLIHELDLEDSVIYTGEVEDIKAAIAALDVLVLPSVQPEPFGGVIVEAMALSRPVVATQIGGSLEQVIDGVTGYLVEPGNIQSLSRGIERLLESPDCRRIMGENGHTRFLEKFEFEPFYHRILNLYETVMALK